MKKQKHIPVLLEETVRLLNPQLGDRYLDLTAGYGGHAKAISGRIGSEGSLILVDRDEYAAEHLKKMFAGRANVRIKKADFLSVSRHLKDEGQKFDIILADLGLSSIHLDHAGRGFSLRESGPLDMRMDSSQSITAANLVNGSDESELVQILREYGEIRDAKKLTKKIVQSRPLETTTELAEIVARHYGHVRSKIHPATKVFQALRIAVNDELIQLVLSLPIWIDLLATGGRIGVISFHSLEDRLVKQAFQEYGGRRYDATLQAVTRKPITPSKHEIVFNPRARSAKLRVAQRK